MTPQELERMIARLGHEERDVAVTIVQRLVRGREQYGELRLAIDQRDFRQEAAEEALDLAVYAAMLVRRLANPPPCMRCLEHEDLIGETSLAKGTDPGVAPIGVGGEGQAL